MKRFLSIILTLALLSSFTACKKSVTSSDTESNISEISSIQTENTVESEDDQTSSETDSAIESTPSQSIPEKPVCVHNYSVATCTAAAKCALCGAQNGNTLGHSYSYGKCIRCGVADLSVPTYKAGGNDTIIRTVNGKSTTIKVDMTVANERIKNSSHIGESFSYDISYTKFFEVNGWLYFSQTFSMKFTYHKMTREETIDEVFKVKIDGTGITNITPSDEGVNKGLDTGEIFGFNGNDIYFSVFDINSGGYYIYKAPISSSSTNIVTEGIKIADSFNEKSVIYNCKIKDGYLYFSERNYVYNFETSSTEIVELGEYKVKLDGTGMTKLS